MPVHSWFQDLTSRFGSAADRKVEKTHAIALKELCVAYSICLGTVQLSRMPLTRSALIGLGDRGDY